MLHFIQTVMRIKRSLVIPFLLETPKKKTILENVFPFTCTCVAMLCALVSPTFGVEGPLWSAVLVQVHSLMLTQLAHLLVKLPGDVCVRRRDGAGHALGPEEPVDLWGGGEDAVVGPSAEHQPHVRAGQIEVARRQKHGRVRGGAHQ